MRRPLIRTSVRSDVSPRSEIDEMPPVVAPEADDASRLPLLDAALIVCISCSTLAAPVCRI